MSILSLPTPFPALRNIGYKYTQYLEERVFGVVVATRTIFGWFFFGKNGPEHNVEVESIICSIHAVQPGEPFRSEGVKLDSADETASVTEDPVRDNGFLWETECLGNW